MFTMPSPPLADNRKLFAAAIIFASLFSIWVSALAQASSGSFTLPAATDRVALIIGNADYTHLEKLKNPLNDARALAGKLGALGFSVTHRENLVRRDMARTLNNWLAATKPGQTALIYFAGHGIEVKGRNYLLPIDTPLLKPGQEALMRSEAVLLDDLLSDATNSAASRAIVILDACRNNPMAQPGTRSVGTTRGMARVDNPYGTFVMYAAGARQTALDQANDGSGNGLFTKVLLKHLGTPKLELRRLAIKVRDEVASIANANFQHRQIPSYYDQMTGDFFFANAPARPSIAEPKPRRSKYWPVEQIKSVIDGKTLVFGDGAETIYFSTNLNNTLTRHLGHDFIAKNIRKDVVAQFPFLAKVIKSDGSTHFIEGIGGIAKGTQKGGSMVFLLQSTAADKSLERFSSTDRVFATLRLKGPEGSPECARSGWQSLLGFKGKLEPAKSDCELRSGNHLVGN